MTRDSVIESAKTVGIDFVPERPSTPQTPPGTDVQFNDQLDIFRCNEDLDGWQDFELLPPSYRARRQSQRALNRWSSILLVLLSIAIGTSIALWTRGRRMIQRNTAIIALAEPVGQLRQRAELLETENTLLEKWCQWVESAKPDDSAMQVLGAVATATHPNGPLPPDRHLDVQSIEVKLPVEYDVAAPTAPSWAEPSFSLTVRAHRRDVLMPWNERLERIERLKDLKVNTPNGNWQEALIQVGAVPLSTKVVP
ncbi:MAG: hypothetical protein KDB00_26545 [Planctomycetales bacterium]|nr:hypothetical protein [Planctomycetales bacterium]